MANRTSNRAARMEHSAKPPVIRDLLSRLLGDVPRIELFSRDHVDGWDRWGNQLSSSVELRPGVVAVPQAMQRVAIP